MYLSKPYPKIKTVWDHDPATEYKTVIPNAWSRPEFSYLQNCDWLFTEKIDGMNIRVEYRPLTPLSPKGQEHGEIVFGGRSNAATISPDLLTRLHDLFTQHIERFEQTFKGQTKLVTLYGEGFGKGIRPAGHTYIPDGVDFRLFDVKIGDEWLDWYSIAGIAVALDIFAVPFIGRGGLLDAIYKTREPQHSQIGNAVREGLVMRPHMTLLDKHGRRIITKIKTSDFVEE